MDSNSTKDMLQAGTGVMLSLTEGIRQLDAKGYSENLVPHFDHLSCRCDSIQLYPKDISVDGILRFENSSDPDDQAILYAISAPSKKIRGLYVDSYGIYHDELSEALVQRLRDSRLKILCQPNQY